MHAKRKGKMLESGFETSRLEYPHPSNTPRFRPVVSKNVLNKNGSARLKSEGFQEGHWQVAHAVSLAFYSFVQPSIFLFRYNRLDCFQKTIQQQHSKEIIWLCDFTEKWGNNLPLFCIVVTADTHTPLEMGEKRLPLLFSSFSPCSGSHCCFSKTGVELGNPRQD